MGYRGSVHRSRRSIVEYSRYILGQSWETPGFEVMMMRAYAGKEYDSHAVDCPGWNW